MLRISASLRFGAFLNIFLKGLQHHFTILLVLVEHLVFRMTGVAGQSRNGCDAIALATLLLNKSVDKRLLGQDHPDVAANLNNLAFLYKSQRRYTEAEPLYVQPLELSERVLGVHHPNTIIFRKNLALCRQETHNSSV